MKPFNPAVAALAEATERALASGPSVSERELVQRKLAASHLAAAQTTDALTKLHSNPATSIRFPYESVHRLVGKVAPGRLLFVMANTGQGKTTFMLDLLNRWACADLSIDYLGTEQEPDELRTKWACLRADVPAHVAINLEWDEYAQGESWKQGVEYELGVIESFWGETVVFHPDKFITLPKIEQAAADAAARGAHVLIVDHIDRVETGAQENEYLALKKIIRRLKEMARDHRLVLVVASQVNRKGREGDRLAVYRPPRLETMQGGGAKEQEADVVLGLWRPIRQRKTDESPDEFKAVLAMASRGDIEPRDFIEPNVMAIVCLKHRTNGNEGMRCKLAVHHGRLSEIAERDQYTTSHGQLRKVL